MTRIHGRIRKCLRTTRTIVFSAATAIAVCVAGHTSLAFAQQSSAPVLDSQHSQVGVWPAPVGHRQPTEADLPPSMRHDEGAITPGQRNFNQSLKICRDC